MKVYHGGHFGDIVYSLPFLQLLLEGKQAEFYMPTDVRSGFKNADVHPCGLEQITPEAFAFIKPFLESLPYISSVHYEPFKVADDCFKLDFYRYITIQERAGSIPAWHRKYYGADIKLEEKWLDVEPWHEQFNLVCTFTKRYRNIAINYNVLKDVENVVFVGLPYEYELFIKMNGLDNVRYIQVSNALEMARVIRSANFFLGNQTFAFALAEAMKIPRALEVFEPTPNVIPMGYGANEYLNNMALGVILIRHKLLDKVEVKNRFDYKYREHLNEQEALNYLTLSRLG